MLSFMFIRITIKRVVVRIIRRCLTSRQSIYIQYIVLMSGQVNPIFNHNQIIFVHRQLKTAMVIFHHRILELKS